MDIIRITMRGYGCEVNRGIIAEEQEKKIEKSLNNVWFKNLFKKLEKKTEIKTLVGEIGLINGDIEIEVNGVVVVEMPIKSFETMINTEISVIDYPKTEDTIITSIQHQEGVLSDTTFLLDTEFDLNKLKIVKKDIKDKVDNSMVSSLYCEIHYDGEVVPMSDNLTDLRMSRLYLENNKKNEQKKNKKS